MFIGGCATPPSAPSPAAPNPAATLERVEDYVIQPGDQLEIRSFYAAEINTEVTVRPDGKISLQLVDDVVAAGLTPAQLDFLLTDKYRAELKEPEITVIVKSFAAQQIYVGGEVKTEGVIALAANMTPLQAVIISGGFNETAKPESTIVIRKGLNNRPVPIKVNLHAAINGKNDAAYFRLKPHDIVFVPKSTIAKANKFVNQYIEQLLLFKGVSFGFSYELFRNQ